MKLIGICGQPTHGKSTAQEVLSLVGVEPRDDSLPLRRAACSMFGLTWEQVTTESGKNQMCWAFGREMTVRQAIGDLGKVYEECHGSERYWIDRALQDLDQETTLPAAVSFGSLRMSQPQSIAARGGFVLGVINPRRPFSEHDFDQFDYDDVECFVINDSTLGEYARRVLDACQEYLELTDDQIEEALSAFYRRLCMLDNTD